MVGATGILVGSFFLNSLYLQHVLGASALEAGLGFLPIAVTIAFAAHAASHLFPRAGSRAIAVAGLLLVAVPAGLLAATPSDAGYAADLLPGFLLLGLGIGVVFPAVSVTAMSEVDSEGAGMASGMMMTAHEIGAAVGVAVLAAVAASASPGDLQAGYGDGFRVAAEMAIALALAALVALPVIRPAPGTRAAIH